MKEALLLVAKAALALVALGAGVGVVFLIAAGAYEALLDWLRGRRP